MKKRLFILLMCFLLVFTLATPIFAEQAQNISYANARATLERFEVVDENKDLSDKISFGEFLGLAMKLTGISNIPPSSAVGYSDVSQNDKYYGAVVHATNMGIVSGYGDGRLGYNDTITMNRAAKILVVLLGYEPYAASKGGWPSGYMVVAGTEGITDGVECNADQDLTYGEAYQMIYNCLETEILQPKSYPTESYTTFDGQTPLTMWMKISCVEGVVTSSSLTDISGGEGCEEGYVAIDGELYVENGTFASDYLACKVNAYYKEEGSRRVLLHISTDSEGAIYEISGDTIEPETSLTKIYYYPSDAQKVQTVSVSSDAYIFYNFKKYTGTPTDDIFKPQNGSLKLIDYDGDKKCDVVYVSESKTYVVDDVSHKSGIISDKYGLKDLRLFDDDDKIVKIIMDGVEATVEDIAKNQVLTVTESLDGKFIQIEISYRKVKGILEGKSQYFITMKDHNFELLKQNKAVFDGARIGSEVTVLLDKFERASGYFSLVDDGLSYGYLVKADAKTTGIGSAEAFLKIFAADGQFYTYRVADDVTVDSSRTNSEGKKYDGNTVKALFTKDNGKTDHQLIKFALNDEGKIQKLQTAKKNRYYDDGGTGVYDPEFSLEFSYYAGFTQANRMLYKGGTITNKYIIGSSMGISIPSEDAWNTLSDSDLEKLFSIFVPEQKYVNDEAIKMMDIYDVDESYNAAVIIVEGEAANASASPDMMLLESVSYGFDEDGIEGMKLNGMYMGKYQSVFVKTESEAFVNEPDRLSLKSGDIVRLALDSTGRATNIVKVFTLDTSEEATGKYAFYSDKFNDLRGKAEYIDGPEGYTLYKFQTAYWEWAATNAMYLDGVYMDGGKLCVNVGKRSADAQDPPHYITGHDALSYVYIYNEATGKVRLGSFTKEDIYDEESRTVFIWNRYGVARNLIIFEHKDPVTDVWWEGYYDK